MLDVASTAATNANAFTWIVDAILIFMVIEGFALVAYQQWTGRGIAPFSVLANLLAGGGILLALRAYLASADPILIIACFGLSFIAHCADIRHRWVR
jgi:uncharacterized protein involved in response to NO